MGWYMRCVSIAHLLHIYPKDQLQVWIMCNKFDASPSPMQIFQKFGHVYQWCMQLFGKYFYWKPLIPHSWMGLGILRLAYTSKEFPYHLFFINFFCLHFHSLIHSQMIWFFGLKDFITCISPFQDSTFLNCIILVLHLISFFFSRFNFLNSYHFGLLCHLSLFSNFQLSSN